MLTKEDLLFDRDEKGELISKKVKIKSTGQEIVIIPLTRGEIKKIGQQVSDGKSQDDFDEQIIKDHLIEPKLSQEDMKFLKPGMAASIVQTILEYSSLTSGVKDSYSSMDEQLKKN